VVALTSLDSTYLPQNDYPTLTHLTPTPQITYITQILSHFRTANQTQNIHGICTCSTISPHTGNSFTLFGCDTSALTIVSFRLGTLSFFTSVLFMNVIYTCQLSYLASMEGNAYPKAKVLIQKRRNIAGF